MKINESNLPKLSPFPHRVTLELTNKCNLNCVFCPRKLMNKNLGFMPQSLAKKLIDEMAVNLPVTLVPFFRGESLLHPNWHEIIHYAKQKGLGPVQLTSNATKLNLETAEKILDLEIDFISFSLDTTDSKLYESTRRGGNYEMVLNNILNFLELREKKNTRLPEVQISSVETLHHKAGIDAFVKFWQPKADRVRIYIEHSTTEHPGAIATPLPHFLKRLPCHKPFTDIIVLWDGDIALCNHDWTRTDNEFIGNVTNTDIANIWHSDRYQQIRTLHHNSTVDAETLCKHCDHWKMYYLEDGFLGHLYTNRDTRDT